MDLGVRYKLRSVGAAFLVLCTMVVAIGVDTALDDDPADAGVFFNDTEFTYKEYWADHDSFTAGCGASESGGGSFYIEPDGCLKEIFLDIPDDVSGAIAAVINVNLWRNRQNKSARFTINDGPQYRPSIGRNFSRTPFTATVPLTELVQGQNSLKFQEATGPYHVHDVMIRVYYDTGNPLVPGPSSDVTPPGGTLTSIQALGDGGAIPDGPVITDLAAGGTLDVDANQIRLTADASGAAYVEFHAYYDGYDEDNDGVTLDWHNFLRNNWGPGGTEERVRGATIGHIATDANAPYEVTWDLPHVVDQSDVKFKIRVVDANGNAREAAGGVTGSFTLQRSYEVETYTIPNFPDQALYFDGSFPQLAELEIDLPADLEPSEIDRAFVLGNYWNSPDLSINAEPPFAVFQGPEDIWETSFRELPDPSILKPGANTLEWNYRPPGFGAMIEAPGPMFVIHRDTPAGSPVITTQPTDVLLRAGQAATLSVTASGEPSLAYQWMRDNVPIVGATSPTYVTPALLPADDGATYSVEVTNNQGSTTSNEATITVASVVPSSAAWWDVGWDFRTSLTVLPEDVARTDKLVEQILDFSTLMAEAGSGGPTFDPNSIRVLETDSVGTVIDAAVPYQFEPRDDYDPVSNAVGTLVWELTGATAAGQPRYYHVYFDKAYKAIAAPTFTPQIVRTDVVDQGFDAYRFDLADGSSWYFHKDGGGFGSIFDIDGRDWISWNSLPGTQGDFRGLPNAVKPPAGYFHPGRSNKTTSTILFEGPLRIVLESRANDNSWISEWVMNPRDAEFTMTRANTRYWFLYEGTPGGEVDDGDMVYRADGTTLAWDDQFEADLPTDEWQFIADTNDNRSFFMAHQQNDGSVESYRLLDDGSGVKMPVLSFGRGGLNLNSAYLRKVINTQPQSFTVGLSNSIDPGVNQGVIESAYKELSIVEGSAEFNGISSGASSDDFSAASLSPFWTQIDPQGDTTFSFTGSSLLFDIPAGVSHDLWEGRNFAPRLLQPVGDTDLDLTSGWLSTPTEQFQGQGLLLWQDDLNWIRYTADHDGTRAKVVVYKMVDGDASQVIKKNLPGVATRFLRVIRSGDTWTFQRSYNGNRWFSLPDRVIPLNLAQVGVVATAHASNPPAFLAELDFFESKSDGPINDDAPQISNVTVTSGSRQAVITWDTNVPADTVLNHGPSLDLEERVIDTEMVTQHSVTVDFLRCDTPYFVQPQSTSEIATTVGDVVTFATDPCPVVSSDDFSTGSLSPFWTFHDPVGDTAFSQTNTNVVLSVPADSEHNLFSDENQAARLRQPGPVGDFEVEAKFESVLNKRFQIQGIVIEEDEDSFIRFEVHHDGTETRYYMIPVLDNVASSTFHTGALPTSVEHYVRVGRSGNSWTMSHSVDGTNWTALATQTIDLDSRYVGPYIGNTATGNNGVPPALLGSIDYFFNTANPIVPEDGGAGPDLTPPVISGVNVQIGVPTSQSVTVDWVTDEHSTTRVEWGLTNLYGEMPYIENTATVSHSAVLEPLACGTTYHFQVSSNDPSGNVGTSPDATFTTAPCPAGPFSDNFDSPTLDPRWFVNDPRGDSTWGLDGNILDLSVPAGVRHDLTPNNNGALRALQAVPDDDFEVHMAFESPVNFNFQLQGIMFEQDANNLIRFDLFNDGSGTKAFVGVLTPSNLQTKAVVAVPGAAPSRLRVIRTGTTWQFDYSPDRIGANWQNVFTGTLNLTVARMGPFAGNANPQIANVPPHSALVDYFWTTFDPIAITGPGAAGPPQIQVFDGAGAIWDEATPIPFGALGQPQPDINIRGRVTDSDGIQSLTYSVNGGDPVAMGIGTHTGCEVGVSCTRRLAYDGDFNADVLSTLLSPGPNTITLRAVDSGFNETVLDVLVDYTVGQSWPLPYSIDWTNVTDLNAAGLAVDGRWGSPGDTLEIQEIGYDRLFAVGDDTWTSFEAEVPITINSFDPAGYEAPSGGPGIGFIPHWRGHVQAEFTQPKYGFAGQLGALVWYRYRDDINAERLEIRDSNATLVAEDLSGRTLDTGVEYIFKLQADTDGGTAPTYRFKVYEANTPEPNGWDLITSLPPSAPASGALVLVAHHVDATFGDLQVREMVALPPDVTPATGSYNGLVKIEMTTPTSNGEIRYTLDGSEPTAASPLYTEPFFVFESGTVKARTYRSGFVESSTTERTYAIGAAPDRVVDGLEALYRFDEGAGTTVADSSLAGTQYDLDITAGSDVTWLTDVDAIRINGPSTIRSVGGVSDINADVKASRALTVEMWIDPATFDLSDATLFNLATDTAGDQNFELQQQGRTVEMSLRTSNTGSDGSPSLSSGGILQSQLHHLVYTRQLDGNVDIYIDGQVAYSGFRGGNLNGWNNGYALSLVNSVEEVNPWTGDLYLTAIYSRDLSAAEVAQNFEAGPVPPPNNFAPVVDAGTDITIVEGEQATMAGSATDDGNPTPPGALTVGWTQVSGPGTAVFSDTTSPTSTVTFPVGGVYVFELSGDDGEDITTDQVQVEVLAAGSTAPAPTIDPASGSYPGLVTVTITTGLPGAEIRYTIDGNDPTAGSTLYTGPFDLTVDATVKARVYRTGLTESAVSSEAYIITPADRVAANLLALYPFNETTGNKVRDQVDPKLNLTIANLNRTTRVTSGLQIDQGTVLQSASAAKINNAVEASGEITVELWVEPADLLQSNAMMFGLSTNPNARNLGLIQEGDDLDAYMRSNATNTRGEPPTLGPDILVPGLMHVVFIREAGGTTRTYIDGVEVATGTVNDTLTNWVSGHRLTLGAERNQSKPWLGTFYMLALYDRALTPAEVLQNYTFGDI